MLGYSNHATSSSHNKNSIKLGRHMNDKKSLALFGNVIYVVDDSLPELTKTRLRNLLQNNGGTPGNSSFDPDETPESERLPEDLVPNLYISQNRLYPYECKTEVQAATPLWVEKAVLHGFVHDLSYYSPVLKQFLSGVVLLLLDQPDDDRNSITNEIKRFGGQYRDDLTDDVTHLICLDPRGAHYNQCVDQDIPVVLPKWLDDCFQYRKKMDVDLYRFPDPIIYYEHNPTPAKLYAYNDKEALSSPDDDFNMVFEDEVIYFGKDVNIKEDFKAVLDDAIVRAGGTIAHQYNHQYVTIVVLKHRSTHECRMASKDKKLIASLWWITNSLSRGHYNSPLCTLLDYPTPPGGLPGFENNVISIGGYGNEARQYLRRLVVALGARYDPSVDSNTTHLICGRKKSDKYSQAQQFTNITIINHTWLEECYRHWTVKDCNEGSRFSCIPQERPILDANAGRANLLDTELARWMNPQTIPEFSGSRYRYELDYNSNNNDNNTGEEQEGSVNIRKRRRAAVKATRVLSSIVIPDVNAYEKESRKR